MLSVIFLVFSSIIGYLFLKRHVPVLFKITHDRNLFGRSIPLQSWMLTLPGSFLIGVLFVTWFTYLSTWCIALIFPGIIKPLLFGNLITFILMSVFLIKEGCQYQWDNLWPFNRRPIDFSRIRLFLLKNRVERIYVFIIIVVYSFLMFRSFYQLNKTLHIGISVFSDFGNTLSILRSFSWGSNFPTEFPHFAGAAKGFNDIRYHFMFQFLAGNLEYLGMRIDWALNLPSILAMVSFLMLLYSFAVLIIGKKWPAIFTVLLFFFRSSFAFFTNLMDLKKRGIDSLNAVLSYIITNSTNIGKTEHEVWGFWTQKVFVNKRHYIFSLGVALLILIVILPLYDEMRFALKQIKRREVITSGYREYIKLWINEFIFKRDSWRSTSFKEPLIIGLVLGMISFWNGATVIAVLSVLFVMALFSKHRFNYVYIGLTAIIVTLTQTMFFIPAGSTTKDIGVMIGFLAFRKDLAGIILYYIELLGILPIVLILSWLVFSNRIRWLSFAFTAPLIMATFFKFSVDIGANHVIIIFSVILLNIIVAAFLFKLVKNVHPWVSFGVLNILFIYIWISAHQIGFSDIVFQILTYYLILLALSSLWILFKRNPDKNKIFPLALGIFIASFLVVTGIVDIITLYNQDIGSLEYKMDDRELVWIKKNTGPNDIFLINPDYQNNVLLAGRKVFLGGLYFTFTSGYDNEKRVEIVKEIYEMKSIIRVKKLISENNIKYLVIDEDNRRSEDYLLNEQAIRTEFKVVFEDNSKKLSIYRTF